MALIQSCYRCEGKTKNKLAKENSHIKRYRNCYRAIYPNINHNHCKEKAVCKQRDLS